MKLDHIHLDNACGEPECGQPCVVGYVIEAGWAACGDGWNTPREPAVPDHALIYTLDGEPVLPHCCAGCGVLIDEDSLARAVMYELTGEHA